MDSGSLSLARAAGEGGTVSQDDGYLGCERDNDGEMQRILVDQAGSYGRSDVG